MKKVIIKNVLLLSLLSAALFLGCSNGAPNTPANSDPSLSDTNSGNPDSETPNPDNPDPEDNLPKEYKFHDTITYLSAGTDGTNGTEATYVLFGDWPQTVLPLDSEVQVDRDNFITMGGNTYYKGSDLNWYMEATENAADLVYTYSDNSDVLQLGDSSKRYFKVEPLKWRVLTTNYNGNETTLLLSEKVIHGLVPFYLNSSDRTINSKKVLPCNYKYSTVRAYLNGKYEDGDTQPKTYENSGFLQSAFTTDAQNLIAVTKVDNSKSSVLPNPKTSYTPRNYCEDTEDKVFLLSSNEATTSEYGFGTKNEYDISNSNPVWNSRMLCTTDFAICNYAYQSYSSKSGSWYLRSPADNFETSPQELIQDVNHQGKIGEYGCYIGPTDRPYSTLKCGIAPAIAVN